MLNPKWICILNPCKFCLWREGEILQHLSTWAAEIIFSQAHSKGMWSNLVGMGSKGPAKSMSFLWMSSGLPGMGSRISGQRSWKKNPKPQKEVLESHRATDCWRLQEWSQSSPPTSALGRNHNPQPRQLQVESKGPGPELGVILVLAEGCTNASQF